MPGMREDHAAAGTFHVTPRGFAGPNLLAMILFEKFGQHQPLNRQSERYRREGIDLSVSTLADQEWRMCVLDLWRVQTSADRWIEAFCDLVQYWKPIGWAEEQGQIRDQGGCRAVPGSSHAPAARIRRQDEFPDTRRQGGAGAVHPRTDGAQWPVRSDARAVVWRSAASY